MVLALSFILSDHRAACKVEGSMPKALIELYPTSIDPSSMDERVDYCRSGHERLHARNQACNVCRCRMAVFLDLLVLFELVAYISGTW